jgi:hypothetical protein
MLLNYANENGPAFLCFENHLLLNSERESIFSAISDVDVDRRGSRRRSDLRRQV